MPGLVASLGIYLHSEGPMENSSDNPGGEIVVRIDRLIEDIVDEFLQHRRENVTSILDALEVADFEAVAKTGHDIEGSAGAFGFHGMAEIGISLRQAARQASPDDVKRQVDEMVSYLGRLKVVYE